MFAKTHGVCGACPVNQTPFLLTTPINIAKYNTRIAKYNTKTNPVKNLHKINGFGHFLGRAGAGPVPKPPGNAIAGGGNVTMKLCLADIVGTPRCVWECVV